MQGVGLVRGRRQAVKNFLMDGKIVKSGNKDLALDLEKNGYDWIKKEVTAHRAGAYAMNKDTLYALAENDIIIDSSMYKGSNNCKYCPAINVPQWCDGIYEIPVTFSHIIMFWDFIF